MQHGQHCYGASISCPLVYHAVYPSDHPGKACSVTKHHSGGLGLCAKNSRDTFISRTRCILCVCAHLCTRNWAEPPTYFTPDSQNSKADKIWLIFLVRNHGLKGIRLTISSLQVTCMPQLYNLLYLPR